MSNCKLPFLFLLLLLGSLLFGACLREPSYPRLLVEADSAMRWGHYDEADSLLAVYDQTVTSRKRSVHRYCQLLGLESKFLQGNSSIDDLLLADSLKNYYERSANDKHAKAIAILGNIYRVCNDYPTALNHLLHAEEETEKAGELWLKGIICKAEGQIYLDQRMFDEMVEHFRRSYNIAFACNDTLRMAHASFYMGKVCTYQQKLDSIVFYYERAIDLGKYINNPATIVPYARYELADIYLQIEEFDKAATLMPRDTLNDVNWGYWHYQQNHTDSAIYYFQKALHRYPYSGQADLLRLLAELELRKGHTQQSNIYYQKSLECKDSVISQSHVKETLHTENIYQLNALNNKLAESKRKGKLILFCLVALIIFFVLALAIAILTLAYQRKKKKEEITYEKLLRLQMEQRKHISKEQIEENNQKLQRLEKDLKTAKQKSDEAIIQRIIFNTTKIAEESKNFEALRSSYEQIESQWKQSPMYKRIKNNAGTPDFVLTDDEWQELAGYIDVIYDDFTTRLQNLTKLSEIEKQICYLTKMEINPTAIAEMLRRQKGSITMARKRLGKKILRRECTAEDFDFFILSF